MKVVTKICDSLEDGPKSTLDIAVLIGKNKKTVSEFLFQMRDAGMVKVTGKIAQAARGRPVNIWSLV
jgi:predicted ArsR family transcriptional regulator